MQHSPLCAIDFYFLSSQPPPTPVLQRLLNQARAWPQAAFPWAYWENQSWDCLKWRRLAGSERGYSNRCVVILGLGVNSSEHGIFMFSFSQMSNKLPFSHLVLTLCCM